MQEVRIPLVEAIQALRKELLEAVHTASAEDLRFNLGPIEIEMELQVTKGEGADAGVRFWLFNAGGTASHSRATTHRVKLLLTPATSTGGEVKVTSFVAGPIG